MILTNGLISQSFVVTLVPPAYVQIALIWGFLAQLGLEKSVHWLWRYKLNEVCDTKFKEEAKNLVLQRFHKWIYVFEKKESKRMLMRKM